MRPGALSGAVLLPGLLLSACAPGDLGETVQPVDWPVCDAEQLLGHVPDRDEVDAHRLGLQPVARYPFGTRRKWWGVELKLKIDEAGQVVCYRRFGSPFDDEQALDERQRAALASLRYEPFVRDGLPVVAIVGARIGEEELPPGQAPMPEAPLEDVRITLERGPCLGLCPAYKVEIDGDGRVVYEGRSAVDVQGRHEYRVPVQEVAQLIERARNDNLWSLRNRYAALITDHPSYTLTLDIGGQEHRIHDYVGRRVGMPAVVSEFEDQIDAVADTDMWIALSGEAVSRMQAAGFDFGSEAGSELLGRALARGGPVDEAAMVRLIELGVPVEGVLVNDGFGGPRGSLLELALRKGHPMVAEALIARGALEYRGRVDQARVDAAFRAAIDGGAFELVKRLWDVSATRPHPALYFDDVSDDVPNVVKRSPVTLLLSPPFAGEGRWEGLEIARWLIAQGCDPTASAADGTTLLHIAADADDAALVRDLLDRGVDASTPGRFGLPALASTKDEDIALMLLEAGTDLSAVPDLRRWAVENHWQRAVAWLDAQGHR